MHFHETLQLQGHCAAMDHRRTAIEFSKIMKSLLFEFLQRAVSKVSLVLGFLLTESVAQVWKFRFMKT